MLSICTLRSDLTDRLRSCPRLSPTSHTLLTSLGLLGMPSLTHLQNPLPKDLTVSRAYLNRQTPPAQKKVIREGLKLRTELITDHFRSGHRRLHVRLTVVAGHRKRDAPRHGGALWTELLEEYGDITRIAGDPVALRVEHIDRLAPNLTAGSQEWRQTACGISPCGLALKAPSVSAFLERQIVLRSSAGRSRNWDEGGCCWSAMVMSGCLADPVSAAVAVIVGMPE